MRLLIDTHALIWYVGQDHLLSPASHAAISDPASELLLSVVSIWEIAIRVSLKKLVLSLPYRDWIEKAIDDLRLTVLHITSLGTTRTPCSGFRFIIEILSTASSRLRPISKACHL